MTSTLGSPVLVTGGSGFLAQHTILALLGRGLPVRATLRSPGRQAELVDALRRAGADTTRLNFVLADLLAPEGWDEAVSGTRAVLHLATPMTGKAVMAAALAGTRHVLEASARQGVKRVVLTSSGLAAARPGRGTITEADWADWQASGTSDYSAAKTRAERLAWELAADLGLELTTILPGAILGPTLGTERPGWVGVIGTMLGGNMPFLPPVRLHMVDVRDLADLHVRALLSPAAVGQRYLAVGESFSFRDVAEVLRALPVGERVARRQMPAWLLRFLSPVNPQVRQLASLLDRSAPMSAEKAALDLDWRPRPVRDSILDTAASLG